MIPLVEVSPGYWVDPSRVVAIGPDGVDGTSVSLKVDDMEPVIVYNVPAVPGRVADLVNEARAEWRR